LKTLGAVLGALIGVVSVSLGILLTSILFWKFDYGWFEVRLVVLGGVAGLVIGFIASL
jgi:hypothetical protein